MCVCVCVCVCVSVWRRIIPHPPDWHNRWRQGGWVAEWVGPVSNPPAVFVTIVDLISRCLSYFAFLVILVFERRAAFTALPDRIQLLIWLGPTKGGGGGGGGGGGFIGADVVFPFDARADEGTLTSSAEEVETTRIKTAHLLPASWQPPLIQSRLIVHSKNPPKHPQPQP